MDTHLENSAVVEPIRSPSYIAPSVLEPSRQISSGSRRWGFGRGQNRNSAYSYFSDRDNRVSIRSSVTYPSDTTFEATVVKGTAQTGQRYQAKTHLIDLGGLRRKESNLKQESSSSNYSGEKKASSSSLQKDAIEDSPEDAPEDEVIDEVTEHQAAIEMYHNAIAPMSRTPAPSAISHPNRPKSPAPTTARFRACNIRSLFRRPGRARTRPQDRVGSLEAGCASIILHPPAERPNPDRQADVLLWVEKIGRNHGVMMSGQCMGQMNSMTAMR